MTQCPDCGIVHDSSRSDDGTIEYCEVHNPANVDRLIAVVRQVVQLKNPNGKLFTRHLARLRREAKRALGEESKPGAENRCEEVRG